MKVVNPVIYAVVLAVSTRRTLWRCLKTAMLNRVVVAALRMPLKIVAKVVNLNLLFLDLHRVSW